MSREKYIKTRIAVEIEMLKAEYGLEFTRNLKKVLKFAAEKNFPLGTLEKAYKAWKRSEVNKVKKIYSWLKKGLSEREVAEKVGCSRSTVWYHKQKWIKG